MLQRVKSERMSRNREQNNEIGNKNHQDTGKVKAKTGEEKMNKEKTKE